VHNALKIAMRNLLRYRRRTFLTVGLIVVGMVFVLVFVSATSSFKETMVRSITDSYLGDIQIHAKGYVESIDMLPLQLNLRAEQVAEIEHAIENNTAIEAYSERIKFGGAFSNFEQITNIRINGVEPQAEVRTSPLLLPRLISGEAKPESLERGKILVPELLARGLGVKPGDTVVVVATNRDGSVNGKTFTVSGILASATGPGGRDGYMHIEDARDLLRMTEAEVSEIAIRLKNLTDLQRVAADLRAQLLATNGPAALEIHTWEQLSPFFTVVQMINLVIIFLELMLVSIVLIGIMNVMIMAVFERVREIGTIAALGTLPGRIRSLFLYEGLLLGVFGAAAGTLVGTGVVFLLNLARFTFSFGQAKGLVLEPTVGFAEVALISVLVISVSLIASLQPAWKASRMEPIDALRHV
jgi:putative ABC transport system permease protein